ncbi:DUF1707 SHOCT-like domain-containing protein [Enemella sp. A6]|uniref:DUF1707 SHOCT-like domain-containing protein n=1 Tax=Enemella sp. A6 TaxID=3440152 RepID=UPI003EC04534
MNPRRPVPDARVRLQQRIGDAERNVAAEQLSTHFAAGRITNEEFDHRLSKVMAARTTEDLWRQLSDLPTLRLSPKPTTVMQTPERRWGGIDTAAVVVIFLTMLMAGPILLSFYGFGSVFAAMVVGVLGAIGGAAFTLTLTRHHQRAVERRSRQIRELGQGGGHRMLP